MRIQTTGSATSCTRNATRGSSTRQQNATRGWSSAPDRAAEEGTDVWRLSYVVGPPFWNTGYATEAATAVCAALFDAGAEAVTAQVYQDNAAASAHVLTRAGFDYVGDGEAWSAARGAVAPLWRGGVRGYQASGIRRFAVRRPPRGRLGSVLDTRKRLHRIRRRFHRRIHIRKVLSQPTSLSPKSSKFQSRAAPAPAHAV